MYLTIPNIGNRHNENSFLSLEIIKHYGDRDMKYSILTILLGSTLIISGCGGGGGSSSESNPTPEKPIIPTTPEKPTVPTTPDTNKITLTKKYSVKNDAKKSINIVKALDKGFAFAGNNILGGSIDGEQWYAQDVDGSFVDVDGENFNYSAVTGFGYPCKRTGVPVTVDGGKTWTQAPTDDYTCGIESPPFNLHYSDKTWLWSSRGTSQSQNGMYYDAITFNHSDGSRFSANGSLKLNGRTKGNILAFKGGIGHRGGKTCLTYIGKPPFTEKSWQEVGTYSVKNVTPAYNKDILSCPIFDKDVLWTPNKPYIQYTTGTNNDFMYKDKRINGYVIAPKNSNPENWEWIYYEAPKSKKNNSSVNIFDMFWAGDSLVLLSNEGIYLSHDEGKTWESMDMSAFDNQIFSSGAWNPRTGKTVLATQNEIFMVTIPQLKNAGISSLNFDYDESATSPTTPPVTNDLDPIIAQPIEGTEFIRYFSTDKGAVQGVVEYPQYYNVTEQKNWIYPVLVYSDYRLRYGDNFEDTDVEIGLEFSTPYLRTLPEKQRQSCLKAGIIDFENGDKTKPIFSDDKSPWNLLITKITNAEANYIGYMVPYGEITVNINIPLVKTYRYTKNQQLDWTTLLNQANKNYLSDINYCKQGR